MATAKQLLEEWMSRDAGKAADAILELVATLTSGQKTTLRDRVVADLKDAHARERANVTDTDADNLSL